MKKIIFLIIFFIIASVASAQGFYMRQMQNVPAPRLILPASDKVVIEKGQPVVFKWSPHEAMFAGGRYYDFRLYEGYNMVQSSLIFKKRLPGNVYQYHMEGSFFKEGQVYTWSLRQGYSAIGKSKRSIQSFRVIKGG